jgi:hypothetical protein
VQLYRYFVSQSSEFVLLLNECLLLPEQSNNPGYETGKVWSLKTCLLIGLYRNQAVSPAEAGKCHTQCKLRLHVIERSETINNKTDSKYSKRNNFSSIYMIRAYKQIHKNRSSFHGLFQFRISFVKLWNFIDISVKSMDGGSVQHKAASLHITHDRKTLRYSHASSGIRAHDPSVRAVQDIRCYRPHGH